MACKIFCFTNYLSHSFPFKFPPCFSLAKLNNSLSLRYSTSNLTPLNSTNTFTWDDVLQVGQSHSDPSDLSGFFHKVSSCNRNLEKLCEFVPFLVEEQIVGYVHNEFSAHLRKFKDVFSFPKDLNGGDYEWHITLHPALKSPESRTAAVADVINCLGEDLIPGIRNELYPVTSCFGTSEFFSLERAAAPYFGIKAYGVHMNGYVEKDGQKFLWLAKRSQTKATFPGMLDHLVAGGLLLGSLRIMSNNKGRLKSIEYAPLGIVVFKPHGIPCGENMIKECEEEAGISFFISKRVEPVGAVSYMDINGARLKRDVLFCYDLKLPEDFVPHNNDGEVESFRLIPVPHAASVIKKTQFFKSNCTLVIIDFLFRHGFICPEYVGYLKLLQSLRRGDFS